jgi:hypothetical protein
VTRSLSRPFQNHLDDIRDKKVPEQNFIRRPFCERRPSCGRYYYLKCIFHEAVVLGSLGTRVNPCSVVTGTRVNPAATNVLSEALSRECVFTEPLPSNGLLRLSGFLTHSLPCKRGSTARSNRALASCWPAMDVHSEFTIPASSRHVTILINVFFIIYVLSQQLQGRLRTQHSVDTGNYITDTRSVKPVATGPV